MKIEKFRAAVVNSWLSAGFAWNMRKKASENQKKYISFSLTIYFFLLCDVTPWHTPIIKVSPENICSEFLELFL